MEASNFDDVSLFKIVVIGDTNTGKTNIITRYTSNQFDEVSRPTIGVEFFQKDIEIDTNTNKSEQVRLQIWDTAGQERFRGMASSYYRKAYGVVLVYDITNRTSFSNLDKWIDEIKAYAEQGVVIILVGNKKDLAESRQVMVTEGSEYARKQRIPFFETSALNNEEKNIEEVFRQLAMRIADSDQLRTNKDSSNNETLTRNKNAQEIGNLNKPKKKSNDCC